MVRANKASDPSFNPNNVQAYMPQITTNPAAPATQTGSSARAAR
jgi:hypothetical protein